MKALFFTAILAVLTTVASHGQTAIQLGYFSKVPTAFKDCGALYTHDSVALAKKKFILLADFQNKAAIMVNGKAVNLLLTNSKTVGKTNVSTYTGGGYTLVVSVKTRQTGSKYDLETGTVEIVKGTQSLTLKIHGQSGCDPSKQEGNSRQ